jgi:hypothetical protein
MSNFSRSTGFLSPRYSCLCAELGMSAIDYSETFSVIGVKELCEASWTADVY